ncbi:RNA polymerase sigma-70 factor [Roseimarinus sediminis]|uniref:RNA polymerase sigma-70 factor n=1 Tax=Roseimarinus sediminis TaxID=1610899 RepID=UPI003D1B3A07
MQTNAKEHRGMNNENQLFHDIKKGKRKSFELLFKSYYAPLCVFARRYIDDPDECEELVQSFFLKLWENRKTINITGSLPSYLFSSVRNRCLNFLQHQKVKRNYRDELLHVQNEDEFNDFPEIDLMQKIEKAIESLPPKRREIFILSRQHGLKYREIANQLNLSVKTVEVQMGHALKHLRSELKDYHTLLISFSIFLSKNNF